MGNSDQQQFEQELIVPAIYRTTPYEFATTADPAQYTVAIASAVPIQSSQVSTLASLTNLSKSLSRFLPE